MNNGRQKTSVVEETRTASGTGAGVRSPLPVFVDTAALMKAHETLAAKTRELARCNAELDHFATLVAHDLRGPLQSLNCCVQLLSHDHLKELSPEGRQLVGFIQESTGHMSRLIRSLLDRARAEHVGLELTPCDANSALRTALKSLQADLHTASAQVTSGHLPVVRGDETQLAQLLQNLIENAIKYRSESAPRVHVSAREEEPGVWTFSVRDNGMGIDPQYFESIFRVFERLRSAKSRATGLGVGLATCKKIVEHHGGRIWVESQPNSGATFFFSLPGGAVISN